VRLVEIRLTGIPLALHARTAQHSDEVMREFAHLLDGAGATHAPARLITLDRILQERFNGFTEAQSAELDEAVARGEDSFDVTFQVPDEVGPAARCGFRLIPYTRSGRFRTPILGVFVHP
jgi:hypothetical protein